MDEVLSRQFHTLNLAPEFHDAILSNSSSLKSTLTAWQKNLSECEIAMHGRSMKGRPCMVPHAETVGSYGSSVDRFDPLFDPDLSLIKPLQTMEADPGLARKRGLTHERYFRLRERDARTEKQYMDAVNARGSKAAIEHLDQQHVFSKMYSEATAMQKASFKTRRKPPKSGTGGPHLAPGTYHTERGLISGRLGAGEVPLTANAAFRDTRESGRNAFLGSVDPDLVEMGEGTTENPFSKRSAQSTINAKGVLNRHLNAPVVHIEKTLGRNTGMTSPEEFLKKVQERETRTKPRDYTEGILPMAYAEPGRYKAEKAAADRPSTAPRGDQKKAGGLKRGVLTAETGDALTAGLELGDRSLAGTAQFFKEWKKANGVLTRRPKTTSSARRR